MYFYICNFSNSNHKMSQEHIHVLGSILEHASRHRFLTLGAEAGTVVVVPPFFQF
jgi:hypothetical protein